MRRLDDELERETHQELAALRRPRAPATLLPRVLAAASRPWYARAWLTWPVTAQVASALVMVALIGGLASLFSAAADTFGTMPALARIAWRVALEPAVAYAFALSVVMALAIPASWAALTGVALGGTSE
jgi:hypothetical protein